MWKSLDVESLQALHHRYFLQIDELADALSGESQQRQQLGFGEWCLLRRGLNLDNAAASGENEIRVGVSAGILRIVQIEYRRTRANTTRYCGDVLAQWQGANDISGFHPGEAIMQRHPAARYGGRSGAAVGLNDIAIDGYLALTERFEIHDGAKAAANKPLDFNRAAALFAGGGFASCPFQGSARQHAIFGCNPATGLALEPGWQAIFERRRHQHMGIAELHKARTFCIFHNAAFERDGAQFIGLAAAWSHGFPPGAALRFDESCAATWLLGSTARQDKARDGMNPAPVLKFNPGWTNNRPQGNHWIMRPVSQDVPIGSGEISLAQLNERSREIFRQIVESYLATGEPVGSRNLSRIIPMTLSPASVRNVMQDLEQLGLIYAPHASAGRLPTELGLRFFVDALMQIGDLSDRDRIAIEGQVAAAGKTVENVLTEASGLLSGLARAAGVVLTAKTNVRLKHIEFVRLEPERALVVLVAEDGQVENRILNLPIGLPTSALIEAANFLNTHIRGKTLAEAKAELERALEAGRAELDQLTQRIIAAGLASWSGGEREERKLIVRGHANLLDDLKAVEDLERVRRLFDELETKRGVADLLGRAERAEGVKIFIGSENKLFSLSGSSTIIAPYRDSTGGIVGVIGVIGPTRLNYARIIPMVDYTAKIVSKLLAPS